MWYLRLNAAQPKGNHTNTWLAKILKSFYRFFIISVVVGRNSPSNINTRWSRDISLKMFAHSSAEPVCVQQVFVQPVHRRDQVFNSRSLYVDSLWLKLRKVFLKRPTEAWHYWETPSSLLLFSSPEYFRKINHFALHSHLLQYISWVYFSTHKALTSLKPVYPSCDH